MSNGDDDRHVEGVTFNRDWKYDFQLSQALIDELELAKLLGEGRVELKTESYLWERTGNICIEYMCDGKPSGIATTQANAWVHQLKRQDGTTIYLMFPVEQLKEETRKAIRAGHFRHNAGDGGRFSVALISLAELLGLVEMA